MRNRIIQLACFVLLISLGTSPAPVVAQQSEVPVPFGDLFDCIGPEGPHAWCDEQHQILADIAWAYWEGRPIVFDETVDAYTGAQAMLLVECLEEFDPPYYDLECWLAQIPVLWEALQPFEFRLEGDR